MGFWAADRELRACARHGHLTYRPTEAVFAARLQAQTAFGEAWRCLRCGDWVLGAPAGTGPARDAPVPPRGKALRQLALLRLLAVERVVRAIVLILGAYGIKHFASAQQALRNSFNDALPAARPLADRLGIDLDNSFLVREATKAFNAKHSTLTWVALGFLAYGLLEGVEGVGLWLARRWAEYLTVVATSAFVPLEIYELHERPSVTKGATFAINVAVVVYLIVAKRLFGVRGGGGAYAEEMHSASLFEIESVTGVGAPPPDPGGHPGGGPGAKGGSGGP